MKSLALAIPLFVFATRSFAANAVLNGDFETPALPPPPPQGQCCVFLTFDVGSNIGGWRVTSGSVDLLPPSWLIPPNSPNYGQSLDLNGLGPGRIEQSLSLIPGEFYGLSFTWDVNTTAARNLAFRVWWNDQITFTHTTTVPDQIPLPESAQGRADLVVRARGNDTLSFEALNPGTAGFLLDNVLVVPEPGTVALLAIGAVVMFGCRIMSRLRLLRQRAHRVFQVRHRG